MSTGEYLLDSQHYPLVEGYFSDLFTSPSRIILIIVHLISLQQIIAVSLDPYSSTNDSGPVVPDMNLNVKNLMKERFSSER